MNVPWVCIIHIHVRMGVVGCIYRAWNSVVFLLLTGIAKPLTSIQPLKTITGRVNLNQYLQHGLGLTLGIAW